MDFLELIDMAHPYLQQIEYDYYPANFKTFEDNADPFFNSLDETRLQETAEELLPRFEQRWAAVPRLKRGAFAARDKTVLALFLAPASARHSETALRFVVCLQELWNRRFPRNTFLLGDYDTIMKGFDKDFLGIKLRKSRDRD